MSRTRTLAGRLTACSCTMLYYYIHTFTLDHTEDHASDNDESYFHTWMNPMEAYSLGMSQEKSKWRSKIYNVLSILLCHIKLFNCYR